MKTQNKPIPLTGTSLEKGRNRTSSAFTLVELIIVITILAILATIGFMSYQSYTQDARDTNRITTIKSAQDGLEIFMTKKSTYPTPDTPVTLTGGNTTIIQGKLGKTVGNSIKLVGDIKDPKTNSEYVYSISGDGKYYQIGTDLENTTSYNSLVNTSYAEGTKALVKGNYTFDPSLPSLITVPGSVNSSSGIFDPNVCFIIDGGTNLVTSTSTTCTQKKNMSLKDFDSSLVGYWDMESLTGAMLKDLSGNGNEGVFSGTILPSSTGGYLGKGLLFSSGFLNIKNSTSLDINGTGSSMTIITTFNNNGLSSNWNFLLNKSNIPECTIVGCYNRQYIVAFNPTTIQFHSASTSLNNSLIGQSSIAYNQPFIINKFYQYSVVINSKEGYMKGYLNGLQVNNISYDISGIRSTTGSLLIGSNSSYGSKFSGTIDDIKIYNRALSDSEIAQQARIAGF